MESKAISERRALLDPLVLLGLFTFCWLVLISVIFYFSQDVSDASSPLYLMPAVLTVLVFSSFLIFSLFLSVSQVWYFSLVLYPILGWGSSLFIVKPFGSYISLYSVLWFFVLLKTFSIEFKRRVSKDEVIFWGILWGWLFSRIFSLFLFKKIPFEVVFLDYVSPLLFLGVLFRFYFLIDITQLSSFVIKSTFYLFSAVVAVALFEMVLRSEGRPWLFLLHGARKLYAGTSGDVTGGLGEPVTLGLTAAFYSIAILYLYESNRLRTKWFVVLLLLLTLISLFSYSRSSLLVSFSIIFVCFIRYYKKLDPFVLIAISVALIIAASVFIGRFIPSEANATGDLKFVSGGFSMELNLAIYLNSITSWMDDAYDSVHPLIQFIMLPLIGGESNLAKLNFVDFRALIFSGVLLIILFSCLFIRAKRVKLPVFPLLIAFSIFYYYGAFGSTAFSTVLLGEKPVALGYVGREAPLYLFILWLVMLNCSLILAKEKAE